MAETVSGAAPGTEAGGGPKSVPSWLGTSVHGLMLFALWVVLSGMFDAFHLAIGAAAAATVAGLAHPLMVVRGSRQRDERLVHLALLPWYRLVWYTVWLLREIAVANWQVLRIVLHPRLPIRPALVRFRSSLRTDLGVTTLANSITLTPGTVTVLVDEGEFVIHALVAGEPVVAGVAEMQRRIATALSPFEDAPPRQESQ